MTEQAAAKVNIDLPRAITTVRLCKLTTHYIPFIKQDMVRAKASCGRCGGRGYTAMNLTTKKPIPCKCLLIDFDALTAAIQKAQTEAEQRTLPVELQEQLLAAAEAEPFDGAYAHGQQP